MPERKSRRRGAELERAILDAAWAELSEVGYARFTVEAVAARAGTSKPVIYRRWANRAELALAAWQGRVPVDRGSPDTGSLRTDLLALFGRVSRRMDAMMNEMIAGVMGEAFRHPEIAELMRRYLTDSPLFHAVDAVVRRAVERGELRPFELPRRAARVPLDLIRNEAVTCGTPPDERVIAELVDEVYLPMLVGLAGVPGELGRGEAGAERSGAGRAVGEHADTEVCR
ncbi:TetR/AcrR family transcriptional regulator [Saccharothrix syringae]|uniref:TetR/AcrR family transcriptional regulator n=1 Tax=Saccharothrix syringae TaxID=103733 RepID=A0A5Q0GZ83_SACSY|nr:TetR/AcrR family transcriptional regulator [Saccharothrix syringae]QFZ19163.1 TetR/AcrR family transcriptional regulator [Saccharothrix syringae]